MLQYTHPAPFAFSDGPNRSSSSTNNSRLLHNTHSRLDPRRLPPIPPVTLTHGRSVDTDLSQDRLSFSPSTLSVSTSVSSLPSPSFPSSSLPRPVPRPSHPSYRSDDLHYPSYSANDLSTVSSHVEDILSPGDIVGEGIPLLGEPLRVVLSQSAEQAPVADYQEPAREFQVVDKVGTGSYAIVYLVREVLSRSPPSEDDHTYPGGRLELDDSARIPSRTVYGREYAIKLLSKADLEEEGQLVQLTEATIHQSIPVHPNIVTLHRTLETSTFLILLLEFVPGQDLFYFLEQARDHYDLDPTADPALNHTPPTPGLLSSLHPSQLLSHTRLRLIASMFAQMCEAVATCHDASVFHRDIKPENFIVTDGWTLNHDGIRERKVVVKLSDFGLSTHDAVSSDMDCGSAPYMSYECRNNVAPVYKPRAADVWSLGIVLINMLYHCNPWVDTVKDGCSSFTQYLSNPTDFFMRRFAGMTLPVADFLVKNVFCILDDPTDDLQRIGAREFGWWIRDLPTLMGASQPATHTHPRAPSTASIINGHPIASAPASSRPASRQASIAGTSSPRRPSVALRSLSRHTVDPVLDRDGPDSVLSPTLSSALNEEDEEEEVPDQQEQQQQQADDSRSPSLRSTSTTKRRKRGRKGKGMTPSLDHIQTSELLASAQTLARELSRQTRSASALIQSFPDLPPVPPVPPVPPIPAQASMPVVTKKSSRWKLSFGRSAGEAAVNARSDSHSTRSNSNSGSARATNVSNILKQLNPPSPQLSSPPPPPDPPIERGEPQVQAQSRRAASPTSVRSGRPLASGSSSTNWRNSTSSTNTSSSAFTRYSMSNQSMRSVSTFATTGSSSSATSSNNWRKHPDPTFPSSSSLASSIVSNNGTVSSHNNGLPRRPPSNVKLMTGVPWEVGGAPRQLHQKELDIFGAPPLPRERKRAARGGGKGKQSMTTVTGNKSALEPITERPQLHVPLQYRQDAATSTTDLTLQHGPAGHGQGSGGGHDGGGGGGSEAPKVAKAQINTLAKLLSTLRR